MPVNKIEVFREGKSGGYIEWDAMSGLIIADSGGVYAVRNPLLDKLNPEYESFEFYRKSVKRTQESRISYKKPEYKYAEIWDYNSRNAVKITQDPNTGEQTRTSYIGTPGNASMKVRKIEKKLPGTNNWKVFTSKFYNDDGYLIREVDGLGILTEFIYDEKGDHWKTFKNGHLAFMAYNENIKDDIRFIKENIDGSTTKIVRKEDGIFEVQKFNFDKKKFIIIYNKYKNSLKIGGIEIFIENND